MFSFINDVTALNQSAVANGLDASLPRWGALFGSGWVLVYPN